MYKIEWFDLINQENKYITNFGPHQDNIYGRGWLIKEDAEKQCNTLNNATKTTHYKVVECK